MGKTKQAKEKKFDRNVEISAPILDPEIIKAIHSPPKGQRLDIRHGGFKALLTDLNSQDSTDELAPLDSHHVPSYIGISCAVSGYSNYSAYNKKPPAQEALRVATSNKVASTPNRSNTNSPVATRIEHQINHITIDRSHINSADEERKEMTEKLTASATERRRSPSPCIPPTEDDRHHGAYVGARYCPLPPPSKLVNKHIPLLGIDDDKDPDEITEDENKVEQKIASLYGEDMVGEWKESMSHKVKKEHLEEQQQSSPAKGLRDFVSLKPVPQDAKKKVEDDTKVVVDISTPDVKVLANVEKQFLHKLLTDNDPPMPSKSPLSHLSPDATRKIESISSTQKSDSPKHGASTKEKLLTQHELNASRRDDMVTTPSGVSTTTRDSLVNLESPVTPEATRDDITSSPSQGITTTPDDIVTSPSPDPPKEVSSNDIVTLSSRVNDTTRNDIETAPSPDSPVAQARDVIATGSPEILDDSANLTSNLEAHHFAASNDNLITMPSDEAAGRNPSPESNTGQEIFRRIERSVELSPDLNGGARVDLASPPMSPDSGNNQSVADDDLFNGHGSQVVQEEHIEYEIRAQSPVDNQASPVRVVQRDINENEHKQEQEEKLVSFSPEPAPVAPESEQDIEALEPTLQDGSQAKTSGLLSSDATNDGHYYLSLMDQENSFITEQVKRAEAILTEREPTLDEETVGKIRSAIGKANLLMNKKCNQFKELCESNVSESNSASQYAILNDDLAGFWDMISIQMADVRKSFETLWKQFEDE